MVKKKTSGRRRPRRQYIRGNIDESLSLGTLAAGTLVSDTFDEAAIEKTLISSIVAIWTLDGITIGQGPIEFGVAHSDYTDAEIEQVIETSGSWNPGDKIQQEVGRRLVRKIGVFTADAIDVGVNDGKPIKTKLNWSLTTGLTLKMWAYNRSGSALSTTVPSMRVSGHANLWL